MIIALRIGAIVIAVNVIELFPVHFNSYTIQGSFHWFPFIGFLVLPTLITLLIAASMWGYPQVFLKIYPSEKTLKNRLNIIKRPQ